MNLVTFRSFLGLGYFISFLSLSFLLSFKMESYNSEEIATHHLSLGRLRQEDFCGFKACYIVSSRPEWIIVGDPDS